MATTAFNYTAIDAGGKQKKGTIEAASLDAARANLKNQGLTPITVEKPNALNKELNINIGGKVKAKRLGSVLQAVPKYPACRSYRDPGAWNAW